MQISISINGTAYTADVEPRTLLVHFIRETAGLTGTHIGCETSYCGACTVLLDGAAVKSCTILAVQASGGSVETVEGLTDGEGLHPVQDGFWQRHGLQCGFCTPGMLMTVKGMLDADPDPSAADIRHGLEGNLCRCTGYDNIVAAVQYAADRMRGVEPAPASWEE